MITRELQALCEGWFGTGADATIEDKSLNETHSAIGEEAKGKIGDGGIIEEEAKLVIEVEIFVPEGREIAKRTFNPKVGIVGGISILGTSGIVRPFSAEAFVEAIRREVEVSVAVGAERLVINSGAKSEAYVKRLYPNLPPQAFVHYGNFIGETLKVAAELHFPAVTMGIMIGKAVKLAEGHLDTHSKHTVMNKPFLQRLAQQAGCSDKAQQVIETLTLARELWTALPHEDARRFFPQLIQRCQEVASPLLPEGELTLLLIDEEGNVIKNEHP
jgi:cobalt-precorrin-5B (C1)-methyltransferase